MTADQFPHHQHGARRPGRRLADQSKTLGQILQRLDCLTSELTLQRAALERFGLMAPKGREG